MQKAKQRSKKIPFVFLFLFFPGPSCCRASTQFEISPPPLPFFPLIRRYEQDQLDSTRATRRGSIPRVGRKRLEQLQTLSGGHLLSPAELQVFK
jgi:hypothetical protein